MHWKGRLNPPPMQYGEKNPLLPLYEFGGGGGRENSYWFPVETFFLSHFFWGGGLFFSVRTGVPSPCTFNLKKKN